MRIAHLAMLSGAALLISASAFAADTQTAAANGTAKDKLVCKAVVHEGMVVPTAVVCRDQHYWDNVRWEQQEAIMQMQLHSDLGH